MKFHNNLTDMGVETAGAENYAYENTDGEFECRYAECWLDSDSGETNKNSTRYSPHESFKTLHKSKATHLTTQHFTFMFVAQPL